MEDKSTKPKQNEEESSHNYIFSKEKVNMGRQPELDYYKAVLIVIMVLVHFYENYSRDIFSFPIECIGFLSGAPGFMFLMGIGLKYSRHHETSNYISRGIVLITKGQIVNFLRYALPNLIAWRTTGKKIFISRALIVLQPDILTFAGFSFFFFALLKKNKLSDNLIFTISIIMNIAGLLLFNIITPPNSFLLKQLLGFVFLTYTESYFSFLSYFIFVAAGYWFGGIYQKIANKDKFYNLILLLGIPILYFYYYIRMHYKFPMFPECGYDEDFCLFPGPDAIASCTGTVIALGIYYKIDKMLKGKTPYLITHTSKNLNKYYIIHYILIMQINTFLRATKGDIFPSKMKYPTLYALMILVLCKITIDINDKYIHFTIANLKYHVKIVIYPLIWITTIISVIYIYPKVETYTTFWNNYLYEE